MTRVTEFFHAKIDDGGLGIPTQAVQARLLRRDRIDGIVMKNLTSKDPALNRMINKCEVTAAKCKTSAVILTVGLPSMDKSSYQAATASAFYRKTDGHSLMHHQQSPHVSKWIYGNGPPMSSSNYSECVRIGAATLHTAATAARGSGANFTPASLFLTVLVNIINCHDMEFLCLYLPLFPSYTIS
jgi:hypothetical protein